MSEQSIEEFVNYRQAYQRRLAAWMAEEGVNAVVFAGEQSTIHLNDSNEREFRARNEHRTEARPAVIERRRPDGDLPGRRQSGRAARRPPAGGTGLLRSRTAGDGVRVRERRPRSTADEVRPAAEVRRRQRHPDAGRPEPGSRHRRRRHRRSRKVRRHPAEVQHARRSTRRARRPPPTWSAASSTSAASCRRRSPAVAHARPAT